MLVIKVIQNHILKMIQKTQKDTQEKPFKQKKIK